ncbi:hypothetical protein D1007_11877 [Hordeum vulgare]|nr:hypothetical protein D1007_11877 [Hordeum vulgare]
MPSCQHDRACSETHACMAVLLNLMMCVCNVRACLYAGPVQQRGEEGGADGGGAGGVQPQRAGAAELRRRHLRGADQRRHRDLQPEAGGAGGPVQHAAGRALHLHQRLRDLPGHPQVAGGQRPDGAEQGMLRGGEEQRAGDLPALPDAVRQQERVPLLGRLPPHGGRQHPRREEGLQRRRPLRCPPRRPADACAPLVILYTQPPSQKRRMGYIYRSRAS